MPSRPLGFKIPVLMWSVFPDGRPPTGAVKFCGRQGVFGCDTLVLVVVSGVYTPPRRPSLTGLECRQPACLTRFATGIALCTV